jgi:hypothetical protein
MSGRRPRMASAEAGSAYQRAWFKQVQARVAAGEPFALVSAEAPSEILRALDIPYVPVQWWSSLVSAKQKAPAYLESLRERGYPDDLEQYFALGLASAFDRDSQSAPWGGLPRPSMVIGDLRDDNHGKIYELWARELGAAFFPFERAVFNDAPDAWWELGRHRWAELIDPAVLDLHVEESRALIRFLETSTGRRFSQDRFAEVLALINEQEEYFAQARDLIAATEPSPVSVTDTFTSVMIPQWHRGDAWARDQARLFLEEIKGRIAEGYAVCPDERARLAWIGTGLWFDVGLYDAFIQQHGAVFVWSMYLGMAADGYARYGEDEPLRTLAARYAAFIQYMTMEPWPSGWYAKEALLHRIDGAVCLGGASPFLRQAFERAGVPLLTISGHNVDSRQWDDAAIRGSISAFIEDEAVPHARRRRGGA